jgi:hypothetical protein
MLKQKKQKQKKEREKREKPPLTDIELQPKEENLIFFCKNFENNPLSIITS